MKNKDRRIQRTYKLLKQSLLQLLQEDEMHNLSIKRLCEKAQVTRQTFYAHFENLQDFIDFISKDMLRDFRQDVHIFDVKLQDKFMTLTTHESIIRIFKHVLQNKAFYEAFLVNNPTTPFAVGFKYEIQNFIELGVNFVAPNDEHLFPSRDIVINYVAAGYFESIIWWIKEDYPYSTDVMAEMLLYISTHGPYSFDSNKEKENPLRNKS